MKRREDTRVSILGRERDTHAEGVPHARERLRDDMQHAHSPMQKREMIVAHITIEIIPRRARVEKAATERGGIEDPCIAEARLGADQRVEKPRRVGEVGAHERVWRAEEVHED